MRLLIRFGALLIVLLLAHRILPAVPSGASLALAPLGPPRTLLLGILLALAIVQAWGILRALAALLLEQTRVEEAYSLTLSYAALAARNPASPSAEFYEDVFPMSADDEGTSVEDPAFARTYIWVAEPVAIESVEEVR